MPRSIVWILVVLGALIHLGMTAALVALSPLGTHRCGTYASRHRVERRIVTTPVLEPGEGADDGSDVTFARLAAYNAAAYPRTAEALAACRRAGDGHGAVCLAVYDEVQRARAGLFGWGSTVALGRTLAVIDRDCRARDGRALERCRGAAVALFWLDDQASDRRLRDYFRRHPTALGAFYDAAGPSPWVATRRDREDWAALAREVPLDRITRRQLVAAFTDPLGQIVREAPSH